MNNIIMVLLMTLLLKPSLIAIKKLQFHSVQNTQELNLHPQLFIHVWLVIHFMLNILEITNALKVAKEPMPINIVPGATKALP
jgi:hypothetical protein